MPNPSVCVCGGGGGETTMAMMPESPQGATLYAKKTNEQSFKGSLSAIFSYYSFHNYTL